MNPQLIDALEKNLEAELETQTELVEALRKVLQRYGGMCLVSDAGWIQH